MISEERAERAVEYYRDHAEAYGQLIGKCKALEHRRKVVFGEAFLNSKLKTVAEREADAHNSDEYRAVVNEIENAWAEKETLGALLKASELTIDVWRSQYSKAGKGHV